LSNKADKGRHQVEVSATGPITDAHAFHERLKLHGVRFIRFYAPIADAFAPWAAESRSRKLEDGTRQRGDPFDADVAAMLLVRVIDLTGLSTLRELAGTEWFQKDDDEFASELGVSVHRFRAARRFLAGGGINLIEYRVLRLPNRVRYRADFLRIGTFFSPVMAGWGQRPLPLGPPGDPPPRPKVAKPPGGVLHNSETRKTALGDAENSTRSCEKRDSNREDLYRKDLHRSLHQRYVAAVERAREEAKSGRSFENIFRDRYLPELDRDGISAGEAEAYRAHIFASDLTKARSLDKWLGEECGIDNPTRREMVAVCVTRGATLEALQRHKRETYQICLDKVNTRNPIMEWTGFWISKVISGDGIGIDTGVALSKLEATG
jgi:hypothetical protein